MQKFSCLIFDAEKKSVSGKNKKTCKYQRKSHAKQLTGYKN